MDIQQEQQQLIVLPRIGEKATKFEAKTTQGDINFPDHYAGKWVLLFSHPADFAPICTTEFITFANLKNKFAKANCHLIGLSIDGLYSLITWLRTIKDKIEFNGLKTIEVKFPLIEDISMEIAKKWGMIQPGESKIQAVRAVLFIDPKGFIEALIYYPLSSGRNFNEIYRALIAMQTADPFRVATIADWKLGDDVIVSPAGSCGIAEELMTSDDELDCKDWFFYTKKRDKIYVLNTVLKK